MRFVGRLSIALAIVSLAAVACGTAATTSPAAPTATPTLAATDTPAPTASPTARPTATPIPMTDGEGPEYVVGTSSILVTKAATRAVVGNVVQYRDQEMTDTGQMNDPRLAGTSFITLNGDMYGDVMSEWGTSRLENAMGTWEGPWTGVSWRSGEATTVSGWLAGSGAYAGWTYYFHTFGEQPFQVEGIIFEGSPPTP